MSQNFLLCKGFLTSDKITCLDANISLDSALEKKINDLILPKIPTYIFESSAEPRTLILEDPVGYNILKLFYMDQKVLFILIRLENIQYTVDEIRKISYKLNQYLDINLNFSKLWEKTQEIFIKIETYDFSRPIKAKLFNIILTDTDKTLRIEEILPKVNKLRQSETLSDNIEFFKLQFLLNYKRQEQNDPENTLSQTYNQLVNFLEANSGNQLNKYDTSSILFNFALFLKDLEFYTESSDAFLRSAREFRELNIERLEIFALLNRILIFKHQKKYDIALKEARNIEDIISDSKTLLSNGLKGIYFRHLGELYQQKKEYEFAKTAYNKSLAYFEKDKQINIDTPLIHLALGTINYNESDFFNASKYFSIAANILSIFNQDTDPITRNLGFSYLNLSNEYLRTLRVLIIEKEFERLIDLLLKGLNYFFLANLYLSDQPLDHFIQLATSYQTLIEKMLYIDIEQEEREIIKRINFMLKEHHNQLLNKPDSRVLKAISKDYYEKLKEFQPLKTYYFMAIYKHNGVVVFSKTSTKLHDLPELDENLIAGMISAISGFLEEVLMGDENLSLIDRDNIKIMLEYSENLIGLLFINKESPQLRSTLKQILSDVEEEYKDALKDWTGEVTKFRKMDEKISKIVP